MLKKISLKMLVLMFIGAFVFGFCMSYLTINSSAFSGKGFSSTFEEQLLNHKGK